MGETTLFDLELRSVYDDPGIVNTGLMLQVKHFVKHHILEDVWWDTRRVKDAADKDRMVSGIISAKYIPRLLGGSGESRLVDTAAEVLFVHAVE